MGWVVSFSPWLLYFWGKSPGDSLDRRLCRYQSWSRCCDEEKNLYPCWESNPGSLIIQLTAYLLYRWSNCGVCWLMWWNLNNNWEHVFFKDPVSLKFMVSFTMDGETVTEMGEVEKLLLSAWVGRYVHGAGSMPFKRLDDGWLLWECDPWGHCNVNYVIKQNKHCEKKVWLFY